MIIEHMLHASKSAKRQLKSAARMHNACGYQLHGIISGAYRARINGLLNVPTDE